MHTSLFCRDIHITLAFKVQRRLVLEGHGSAYVKGTPGLAHWLPVIFALARNREVGSYWMGNL